MTARALLFEGGGKDREVKPDAEALRGLDDEHLLWVDLEGQDREERARIAKLFKIEGNQLAPRDGDARPGFERYGDTFTVNLLALPRAEPEADTTSLDVVVGDNWIVTASAERPEYVSELEEQLRGDQEVGRLDSPAFLAALLDAHVSEIFRVAERLERRVDELDERLLSGRRPSDMLARLTRLRAEVARVRRILAPHREVYAALARPDFVHVAESASAPAFPALVERLERAMDAVESVREQILGTFEVHMARTAQRTNDAMKTLTVLSAVLLPSVALAGIMGMNFKVAFFENPGLFWWVVGAMSVLAALTLALARWRGWI